jgi:hypothetical protein
VSTNQIKSNQIKSNPSTSVAIPVKIDSFSDNSPMSFFLQSIECDSLLLLVLDVSHSLVNHASLHCDDDDNDDDNDDDDDEVMPGIF